MKSKHKALLLSLCAVLLIAGSVFGTLAYLTDTEAVKNTFTVGQVGLSLDEAKVDKMGKSDGTTRWQPTTEDPAQEYYLLPGQSYTKDPTRAGYSFNKGVFTINNADTAYIRNYVAIESIGDQTVNGENKGDIYYMWHSNQNVNNPSEGGKIRYGSVLTESYEDVDIKGVKYDIYVFDTLNNAAVEKNDSFMTMSTIALKKWVTNEMVGQLGEQFNVYTWSEAIQVTGFADHAAAMTALIGDDTDLEAHATRLLQEVMGN